MYKCGGGGYSPLTPLDSDCAYSIALHGYFILNLFMYIFGDRKR